jgi:hypothetical protein
MLTDAALKNLRPKDKIYKVTDRDGVVSYTTAWDTTFGCPLLNA